MFARLLPQGDRSHITHELARLGHPQPDAVLHAHDNPSALKVIDVPRQTAKTFLAWLEQQSFCGGWHHVAGTHEDTVDLLIGGPSTFFDGLGQTTHETSSFQALIATITRAYLCNDTAPTRLLLGETSLDLHRRAYVMGILNITPDSFSDGGLYLQPDQAIKHAENMLSEGADLIDVGGQSSRPGATPIPAAVERERVVPVVREIVKRFAAAVSVDTYRASVAEGCLDAGAVLINDISAMRFDVQMAPLVARHNASVVLMHMQGTPQTMNQAPVYKHVIDEVYGFLHIQMQYAFENGIDRQRMILDPGFGFGKTVRHNLELLQGLTHFQSLGLPILIGTSRKPLFGHVLKHEVWDRLEGSLTTIIHAISHGASLVRVHDVAPVVQAVRLSNALAQPPVAPSPLR